MNPAVSINRVRTIECATDGFKDEAWCVITGEDFGDGVQVCHIRAQVLFDAVAQLQSALLSAIEERDGVTLTCYVP